MKIAIIRERKSPPDRRVALTPLQCGELVKAYPNLKIVVESSPDRIFTDLDYKNQGAEIATLVEDADLYLGIKEVPVEYLVPNKTYCFFSHTIKAQSYNQGLMREVIRKKIRLIDYECLEHPQGGRILGFGFWAGAVGTYNGLLTWGKKFGDFSLKPANECANYEEIKQELTKIKDKLPPIRIGMTGTGRVAQGGLEVLRFLGIEQVQPEILLTGDNSGTVFTNFLNSHIFKRNTDEAWDMGHFYNNHADYSENFSRFLSKTDLLINGFYWEESLPPLFRKEDTNSNDFAIKVIADITCDVEGSVPITLRATYPNDPTFGWDAKTQSEAPPYQPNTIDVMAVTVLPSELPADASRDFGSDLMREILPLFLGEDSNGILEQATIAKDGKLTKKYSYLAEYAGL